MVGFLRGDAKTGVLVVWNLGTTSLSGVKLSLPADYPLGKPSDLLNNLPLPAVSLENRANYPLPTLPPRTGLWMVPSGERQP